MPRDEERCRQWLSAWRKTRRAAQNEQNRVWCEGIRAFIIQQKMGRSCIQCGISDYRVLDFHHRDRTTKGDRLSSADGRNWSRKGIMEEIAKCDLLSANCHRILHWEEQRTKVLDA
jgi:hypothetical protein